MNSLISPRTSRRDTPELVLLGFLLGALVCALSVAAHREGSGGWQLAARYTARLSFLLFMAAYLARPLANLADGRAGWLLYNRRGLGLAFAAAHFVHLFALVSYIRVAHQPVTLAGVAPGATAYIILLAMVLTSNDAAVRKLGPVAWRRLHLVGLHVLWLVMTLTLAARLIGHAPDLAIHATMLIMALGGLALRLAMRLRRG